MTNELYLWAGFLAIVFGLLVLDLGFFQRKAHTAGLKEAILISIFYITVSLIFSGWIYFQFGADKSFEFLTSWIVEKSLSVDNLFVFMIVFAYFKVDLKYQHRVLFWGILGALITRGIFIFTGITLINAFHILIYGFGAFLIITGLKLLRNGDDDKVNPGENLLLKYASKYLPIKKDYIGASFIIKGNPGYYITPLLLVLLVIESTDVMFAFDSVPAVLSITRDSFIVYTSNIFAILGLRALYFVIARIMPMFAYLNYGLAVVLSFIGIKMVISDFYKIPIGLSLGIVASCLIISIIVSMIWKKEDKDIVDQ